MAFGTRPALARVRVNGARTTRLGKRQSPRTSGSSRVGIEVRHFPKRRLAHLPGGPSPIEGPAAHAFPTHTGALGQPYTRDGKTGSRPVGAKQIRRRREPALNVLRSGTPRSITPKRAALESSGRPQFP